MTVVFDIVPERARTRVVNRDGENLKYEERNLDLMKAVRENLLALADRTFLVVEATGSVEEIQERIRGRVLALLSGPTL